MTEYKHIKIHVIKEVLSWYGLSFEQVCNGIVEHKDWSKKEPFTHEWKAFSTIVNLLMCDEMREFSMNKRAIAIYFSLPFSLVDLAISVAYHLKDDTSFTLVKNKVLTKIKEHNGQFYASQSA